MENVEMEELAPIYQPSGIINNFYYQAAYYDPNGMMENHEADNFV